MIPDSTLSTVKFQSTLPVRGATLAAGIITLDDFISIHAPREGSDNIITTIKDKFTEFQSTLPVRGATFEIKEFGVYRVISIHAPREGSDGFAPEGSPSCDNFNPRSP